MYDALAEVDAVASDRDETVRVAMVQREHTDHDFRKVDLAAPSL